MRADVAGLTLGDANAARTQPWHPTLETYAAGVRLMLDLDAPGPPHPDSWLWAANTHGIDASTPPRPAWDQCQHQRMFFLPWHRAYLAWFESTIRRLTGDDRWALPYWNYCDPASDRTVPVEFTVATRTVAGQVEPNPLFTTRRSSSPIPSQDVDPVPALGRLHYVMEMERGFGGVLPDQFDGVLELLPHNFIHVDIGGDDGLMTSPATAARDPIFWLHHSNIDRLWETWLSLPGSVRLTDPDAPASAPVTQWQSATFWFGDEGSPTTYSMADVEDLASAAMGYTYESITLAAAQQESVMRIREEALTPAGGGGLQLSHAAFEWEPVGVTFDMTSGEERDVPFEVAAMGLDDVPPARLMLEFAGATAIRPHAVYVVEVRSASDEPPHRAGRFSTFGLAGTPAAETRNYLVDATSVLPDLLDEGWSGGALVVQLVPEPGRPDSEDPERAINVRQVTVFIQSR